MIVFISNFLNHHQKPMADQLYALTSGEYRFVEMTEMPESFVRNGYPVYDEPWLIRFWRDDDSKRQAFDLIDSADCVVWDGSSLHRHIKRRLRSGKITFEFGERWLKKGLLNFLSPRLLRNQFWYHFLMPKNNFYRLNIGAYAADDYKLMRSFTNKMFRWGYFTDTADCEYTPAAPESVGKRDDSKLNIIWVGRFINFKHPEMAVEVAAKLKESGVDFKLDMYGSGPLLKKVRELAEKNGVSNEVNFCGTIDNADLVKEMRHHDVLLFTSDKREGWGAVVNEAMGCGCVVVARSEAGSVPWLIKDGVNGIISQADAEMMAKKIYELWSDDVLFARISKNARNTVALNGTWGAGNAASSFVKLLEALKRGERPQIESGPCSCDQIIETN